MQPIGWSATSVPEPTATRYADVLAELAAALVLWRRAEQASPAGSDRSRNALACSCAGLMLGPGPSSRNVAGTLACQAVPVL